GLRARRRLDGVADDAPAAALLRRQEDDLRRPAGRVELGVVLDGDVLARRRARRIRLTLGPQELAGGDPAGLLTQRGRLLRPRRLGDRLLEGRRGLAPGRLILLGIEVREPSLGRLTRRGLSRSLRGERCREGERE